MGQFRSLRRMIVLPVGCLTFLGTSFVLTPFLRHHAASTLVFNRGVVEEGLGVTL
jgi:hypothetical protein